MKQKKGYLIWAPNYASGSAGVRCMYLLCDHLNRKGYDAFVIMSTKTTKQLNAPIMPIKKAQKLLNQGKAIVVYPEVIPGNPLKSKFVARWVLNQPGLLGGTKVYDLNERIFYYSEVYRSYIRNKIDGKLYMPTLKENELFFDDGRPYEERTLKAYYIGKSVFQPGFFDENSCLEITRSFPKRECLGEIFRSCKVLYCFDNSSIISYEAVLCGCPVIIIPDGTHVKSDYEKLELGMGGFSWGPGDLEKAKLSTKELPNNIRRAHKDLEHQLDNFIEKTQNWHDFVYPDLPEDLIKEQERLQDECCNLYASTAQDILRKIKTKLHHFEPLIIKLRSAPPLLHRFFNTIKRGR